MQTGASSVWKYTKGRRRRRCVPGNSTHAVRAHSPRPPAALRAGVQPGGRGGARRSPTQATDTLRPARGRGLGSAKPARETAPPALSGFVVRKTLGHFPPPSLVGRPKRPCSPQADFLPLPNYNSHHPPRCGAESENKFWAARVLPSAGCPFPLPVPQAPSRELGKREAASFSLAFLAFRRGARTREAGLASPQGARRAPAARLFLASRASGPGNLWGR